MDDMFPVKANMKGRIEEIILECVVEFESEGGVAEPGGLIFFYPMYYFDAIFIGIFDNHKNEVITLVKHVILGLTFTNILFS